MEQLQKSATIKSLNFSEEDYKEIQRFTLNNNIEKEKLFVFKVVLCDNEVDRDFENFSTKALEGLAELFTGKTGIKDHSMKSEHQLARIFKTEVVIDSDKLTSYGEPYAQLIAKAYMVRTNSNQDLITEIEAGIKKEVSVSCAMGSSRCSICGRERRTERCEHIGGKEYDGKLCFSTLDEPRDAYEFSFVAVPAQRAAGTSKGASGFAERKPYPVLEIENKSILDSIIGALENMSK